MEWKYALKYPNRFRVHANAPSYKPLKSAGYYRIIIQSYLPTKNILPYERLFMKGIWVDYSKKIIGKNV